MKKTTISFFKLKQNNLEPNLEKREESLKTTVIVNFKASHLRKVIWW